MHNKNPNTISLLAAAFVSMLFIIVYGVMSNLLDNFSWLILVATAAILFIAFYLTLRYVLEKFIYEKIKLIYKNIHNLKTPKDKKKRLTTLRPDVIEEVNQEVMNWAKGKSEEIEELQKLAQYRREFIGNISHELKTPIFNIQGYVLTLLDGGLEDPNVNKEYLLRTEKSIDRMIAIVNDLEVISKLEAGELELKIEEFDIIAIANEIIEFLEPKARKRNAKIIFAENYDKPIYIFADEERTKQVLINLIDNAIKYSSFEKAGKVKISFFDMGENVLIEVADNGIGVEKKDIPRLFERFYRTDSARSREFGGSGLGLAIVKHIIEAHNQTINVRSAIGVGTTFGFTMKKV